MKESNEVLARKRKDTEKADSNRARQLRLGHIVENADEVLTIPPAERTETTATETPSKPKATATETPAKPKTPSTATRSRAKKTT